MASVGMQGSSTGAGKPKILVLSLGGTIAMTGGATQGVTPTLTGADLVLAVPGLADVADVESRSILQIPGAHLSFANLESLAREIDATTGYAGFIVTQGTDTIEETAFILDLLVRTSRPVIVTGSMRHPAQAGADGPANVLAAARVAVSPTALSLGTLVVMNDLIHAARFVRKTHTTSVSTFASPLAGPLGYVVEDRVRMLMRVERHRLIAIAPHPAAVKVALVELGVDDSGELIDAIVKARFDGLVVAALGGGHASPRASLAIERAAKVMPVVLASRACVGETLSATYGFEGGEISLLRRGAMRVGWLDAPKARVLLTLLLRHEPLALRDRIARWS